MTRKNSYPRFHAIQSILLNLSISFLFFILFVGLLVIYYPAIQDKLLNDPIAWFLDWSVLAKKISQFSGVFTALSGIITVLILIPIYSAYVGREIRIAVIADWAMKYC